MAADAPFDADDAGDAEFAAWHRRFAGMANNHGWTLAERPALDDDERRSLLYAAYAAAYHWDAIGTEVHAARAELLLARAHALNGDAALATRCAASALAFITGADGGAPGEPWEVAFAHAAMAEAAAARGDGDEHGRFHGSAKALGDALVDADDRAIFFATFDRLPPPLPVPMAGGVLVSVAADAGAAGGATAGSRTGG